MLKQIIGKIPFWHHQIFQNGCNKYVFKRNTRNKSSRPPTGGAYDINYRMKSVRVCVTGGCSPTGRALATLLAQNPLIYGINLHGGSGVKNIAKDLNELDTRCNVKHYHGDDGLLKAIMCSDIVLVLGLCDEAKTPAGMDEKIFCHEAPRVAKIAKLCSLHNPKTYFVVCAHPVSMLLPMCVEIFKPTHMYNPGRVIGSCALLQVRLNTILANVLELNPSSVHVPLLGGAEIENVIPLFNRAIPYPLGEQESAILTRRLYGLDDDMNNVLIQRAKCLHSTVFSEAVALARLTTIIAESLCGDSKAVANVFMRTNVLGNNCRYLTTSVRFAPGGVTRNYGIPQLNKTELHFLEEVLVKLEIRERRALEALGDMEFRKDPADYFNAPCCSFHEENNA